MAGTSQQSPPTPIATPIADPGHAPRRELVRSGFWTALTPLAPALSAIVLTPYVVHRLGPDRYGMYVLAFAVLSFLGSFDGGLTASAGRYFSVHAGRRDEPGSTRLLTTLLLALTVGGTLFTGAVWAAAPLLVRLLHAPDAVRGDGVHLVRLMALSTVGWLFYSVFVSLANAHGRFAWTSLSYLGGYAVLMVGMVLVLHAGGGLRGVAWVVLAQTATSLALAAPAGLRFARARSAALLTREQALQYAGFAWRVQGQGLAQLINAQLAALTLGATSAVREVGVFTVGANYAVQLKYLPQNGIQPVAAQLGREFGSRGHAARETFESVQGSWLRLATGWTAITLGSAWFAVVAWLGPGFDRAGVVATILVAGNFAVLGSGVLVAWLNVVGHPEVEARYSVLCLALTAALLAVLVPTFGVLGAAISLAATQWIAAGYLLLRARKVLPAPLSSFTGFPGLVPWRPALVTVAVVVAVELPMRPLLPGGGLGLLAAASLALPGGVVYCLWVFGPRRCRQLLRSPW